MSKRVYISADYAEDSGDREVVELLNLWGTDAKHKVDFIDMAKVVSGSISADPDCRSCDLKQEFNQQINASSAVIFVIGDKTALRKAGSNCQRVLYDRINSRCTPYKHNVNGTKPCKVEYAFSSNINEDFGNINSCSYLRHEFEQAKRRKKNMIIVYNSIYCQKNWLPPYMKEYESIARPFWIRDSRENRVGNYFYIKSALGYD